MAWHFWANFEATSPIMHYLPFLPVHMIQLIVVGKQARRPIRALHPSSLPQMVFSSTIFNSNPCLFQVKDPQGKHEVNSVERTTPPKDMESYAFTIRYNQNRIGFLPSAFLLTLRTVTADRLNREMDGAAAL